VGAVELFARDYTTTMPLPLQGSRADAVHKARGLGAKGSSGFGSGAGGSSSSSGSSGSAGGVHQESPLHASGALSGAVDLADAIHSVPLPKMASARLTAKSLKRRGILGLNPEDVAHLESHAPRVVGSFKETPQLFLAGRHFRSLLIHFSLHTFVRR
jgi:hypothetical protein